MSEERDLVTRAEDEGGDAGGKTPMLTRRGRPMGRRWLRVLGWIAATGLGLLLVLVGFISWYTGTADFQRRVGGEVVSVLENATGGRVELRHLSFNVWHLAIEADGLVIHGTEAAGELPYLSAEKILMRLHINMVLTHLRGLGPQSRVSLRYLRVEQPRVHLMIDKDGRTNQPVPKHPSTSSTPVQDTLLDLQARKVELADGLAVVNDKAIPFEMMASELNAGVVYVRKTDRYGITVDLANLQTKMAAEPEVQSKLHLTAEVGRDMVALRSLDFRSGMNSHLTANAELDHFAKPEWQATVAGTIALRQLQYLAGVDGLNAGTLELDVRGHNCSVTPQVAQQRRPKFWPRKTPPSAKVLPPDPECTAGYLLVGAMKVHEASYRNEYVRVSGVNAGAQLHITPSELLFTALTAYLPGGGGNVKGELKIVNWLGEATQGAAAGSPTAVAAATTANAGAKSIGAKEPVKTLQGEATNTAHAYLTVTVDRIPLRTIMDATATPGYGDLGFDFAVTGPTTVEWGGPAASIGDTVQVESDLKLAPTGTTRKGVLDNLPVNGSLQAHYDGRTEVVKISHIDVQTPQTRLVGVGILGVSDGDPLTNLQVTLESHDLAEFDQLLTTLDFESGGKKGAAALPVVLHGTMEFAGTAKGPIADLDVKGHVVANDVAVRMGSLADAHIDSVVADAEYAPNEGFAVGSSTIKRGSAVLNVAGTFRPHKVVKRRVAEYDWDAGTRFDTTIKLANAAMSDVLQIAGQEGKVPLTGTANVSGHFAGTVNDVQGSGEVSLTNGVAYGEAYQTVEASVTANGQALAATKVLLQAHGLSVTGSGGYNLTTKRIQAELAGNNLLLSKLDTVRKAEPDADGVLTFTAHVDGTATEPNLQARLQLAQVTVQGKPVGDVQATAYSTGTNVFYDLHSTLLGAQVAANGQTSLTGDYQTQAKLTLSGLDVANAVKEFAPGTFAGSSAIAGTVTLTGPASKPEQMAGTAELQQLELKVQGVTLKAAAPLKASLKNGTVTLAPLHITGENTDLNVSGTAVVLGDSNALGGALHMKADGSVNMAIAHTFDPSLTTSGVVTFQVAADGRVKKPSLGGNVLFKGVNVAVEGVPNGLSNLNGSLTFNEDRLDVTNLTATTGGGQVKIGGYMAFQKGLFADLTATGETVRIRYAGLSATANANLRLQGAPGSLLLSGSVLLTRFGVGADVDFAAFSGGGGVQAPPDPGALLNKVRLDVHVTSAPQLDFQNSYAKLAGTVDLNLRGSLAVPSVLGRIQITDGSATFAGTNYQLQRGNVYFGNPVRIDPTIDLDATARVENYDITIGLHGTPSSIKPTYRSEPPLTEADIFNLLALGRTQEEAQLYQEQQTQAGTDPTTSALLGGALNATVSSRVGKLFGAGSVKIDPAFVGTLGNSSARITVQEPLSKQLTLVFATNVNETAEQLIQVQYQLNENNAIWMTRDESGVFSIVYKIRKRYR